MPTHTGRRHGIEQIPREQRKRAAQQIAAETLRRNRRTGIAMVRVGQVEEDGQIDEEDANGRDAQRNGRHDPVDPRLCGPAEDEETDGEAGGFVAGECETAFGGGVEFVVACGDFFLHDAQDCGEQGGDGDGGEDGALFLQGKVVDGAEGVRDDAEEHVQNRPAEGNPQRKEEDGWIEEK